MAKKKKQTVSSKVDLSKEQNKLIQAAQPYIKKYVKSTSKTGVQLPDSPMTAPTNPLQQQGQQQALAAVPRMDEIAGAGSSALQTILGRDPMAGAESIERWSDPNPGATDFLLNKVLFPETNPALRGAIDAATRPITDQLLEEALPAVRSGAYTTGNFGSSRQGIAEGLGIGKAARAVGDTAAGVANQGYQSGLDALSRAYSDQIGASTSAYGTRQQALSQLYGNNVNATLNALGLVPQMQGAQVAGALTTSGVGDVQQAAQQAGINEEVYRKLFSQMSPLMSAQSLLGLAGATPGGGSTSTTTTPGTSPLSGILGGASLGSALLPGLGALGALGGAAAGGALSLLP